MHLTSHITHSNGYAPYIAFYRSNGVDQIFRKLKPKPKLNPPNAHRSQIKICENRQTQNVQFPFMPNAFRILKPIQKSSKRVWVFRNTGANAFAKNQMRLAYEDKRDLYCIYRFGGLIDGYSALGVVYEVSLEVVLTTHAWCAGDAGIAIWRARLFAAQLRMGAWSRQTYKLYWDEILFIVKLNWVYISVIHNGKPVGYRS